MTAGRRRWLAMGVGAGAALMGAGLAWRQWDMAAPDGTEERCVSTGPMAAS
jgi:hypothetical protein